MNVGDEDYYHIDDDDDGIRASWRRLCQCSPIDPLDFAILDRGHQHLWQEKKPLAIQRTDLKISNHKVNLSH